jgi:hypothetical protein
MTAHLRNLIAATLLCVALPANASIQAPDCEKELDACIRWAVAEVATYVDECGKILPASKAALDAAYTQWSVLKFPIPGLDAVIKPGSAERVALGKKVAPYLKGLMSYEREIECFGRYAMLKSTPPRLSADSISLPRNSLEPYLK